MSKKCQREVRIYQASPVRVEQRAEGQQKIVGLAAVHFREGDPGTEYELWEDYFERIKPGAFNRAIDEAHDVRGLFNHNPSYLLGRTAAGTLRLASTQEGLTYEIDPPDTQVGRDVLVSLQRGDITGSSFSFIPSAITWRELERDGRTIFVREIEDLTLFDVGPVTFPAYASAKAGARSSEDLEDLRQEVQNWQSQQAVTLSRKDRIRRIDRARQIQIRASEKK